MGVKVQRGYKKPRKHRKQCPCTKCQLARDARHQAEQLKGIGVSKFHIGQDWGDEHGR